MTEWLNCLGSRAPSEPWQSLILSTLYVWMPTNLLMLKSIWRGSVLQNHPGEGLEES